uniref:Complement C3-like n=1 Tax=Salmo trutta TaxID=8032 RepID=A0A674EH55_SALTR
MSAPNPLRVGSMERVFVEAQDYSGADFNVQIKVMNFPAQDKLLVDERVSLNSVNKYQALKDIKGPDFFDEDYTGNQYVYLHAQFPSHKLEKVVLVSFQTGYIFIQTDKTIYTPESKVKYRVFALNSGLEPVTDSINVEIMNPDGITLLQEDYKPDNGMKSGDFTVPEITSFGNWKVVAKFKNTPHKNFTADFEVKEYVLPSFEVKLTATKSFFYVDDDELTVNVDARYLFGEPVKGVGFVVFGLIQGNDRTSFPGSLQRVEEGVGNAVLKTQHIKDTFPEIHNLLQKSLYISVNVLTDTGSEMVKAEKKGIFIVKSPYSIHFKKTPLYFKPGMPYDISVYVTNPDGSPAKDIDVEALHKDEKVLGKTHDNGIAKMTINTKAADSELSIVAIDKLGDDRQGTQKMTAKPYQTKDNSKNYIHMNIHSADVKIKDQLTVGLTLGSSPAAQNGKHEITILILSKGQLISSQKIEWNKGQGLMSLPLTVNKDMIPSFRVVAYYHVDKNEVVSDSVWIDVKDTCMGSLKVDGVRLSASYAPRETVTLSIIGDPGAKVGLVAVDKGVYVLNDKSRLTQTKIWDTIEKHDIGCTAGSGKDSMGVFYDAGLVFAFNTGEGTPQRTDCCPDWSLNKRQVTLTTGFPKAFNAFLSVLASKYTGLERQCCMDGMRKNILDYTCERRAQYISDGTECVGAFLKCCREMATKHEEAKIDQLTLARSEEEDDRFESFDEIISRSFFPESWLWNEESLPQCPKDMDCAIQKSITLPDSITSWQITAIGLSKTHGICVSEPLTLIVWKNFFLDLKLPYSAVRNEQLEIKAILHNYMENPITVRVELRETSDVCSSASKKGKYVVTVMVDARSTRSVPFVIIPMKLGLHTIEVKASVRDWGGQDGVKKELHVVVSCLLSLSISVFVSLWLKGGTDIVHVRSGALTNQVPNTPASTHISVTGEQLARTIEAAISGSPLVDLLRQPGGCGEQNMMHMTLPLIATHYLDETKQWDKVGLERRKEAVNFIQMGYKQEMAYRKADGSYATYPDERSGTWLTAYVAKVFAMANPFIVISEDVLCSAVKWLVMERQRPNGIFEESGKILTPSMMGDVLGKDVDDTLTAFVLIAMQEAHTFCNGISLPDSMKKAKQYLESRNQYLTNPYSVAMTSYALANEGKLNKDILFKYSSTAFLNGWPYIKGLLTLEATAYALLALVKAGAFEEAGPIVRWLNRQGFKGGDYSYTQATIMVFQAVAEYMTKAGKVKDIDLNVDIDIAGRSQVIKWSFNKGNALLTRTDKVRTYANIVIYDSYLVRNRKYLQKLNQLKSSLAYGHSHSLLRFNSDRNATMAILDIGLLTGFEVDFEDLKQVSDQWTFVILENRCVKFYHPMKKDGSLNRLCQDDVCRCAEGTMPRWPNCWQKVVAVIGSAYPTLILLPLSTIPPSSIQSTLLTESLEPSSLQMRSTLMFNFSLGTDIVLEGEKRLFLAHPSCRKALDLKEGQSYLLIGDTADLIQSGHRFEYVLGERTWIEYWPTSDECNKRGPVRKRCLEIDDFVHAMESEGCVN